MPHNMGSLDRALRVLIAAPALTALGLLSFAPGTVLSVVALALAGVMLATSAIGFCPLYVPLGISTRREAAENRGGTRAAAQH